MTEPAVDGPRVTVPPGYASLVPFNRLRHAGMGLRDEHDRSWCAALNAVTLGAAELSRAGLDFPVAFTRIGDDLQPIALLGLRNGENLYVDDRGRWRADVYVPAYVRRYPFFVPPVPTAGAAESRVICVAEKAIEPSGQPLFDAAGNPTALWTERLKLIEALEGSRSQTLQFTERLESLGLLTPFEALALPTGQAPLRLQGLLRVDEEKLRRLGSREMQLLQRRNELRAVYAHLLSLENFAKLLNWSTEKDGRRNKAH